MATFIRYSDVKPQAAKMELIRLAASVLEPAEEAGDVMSLRQLYYQFVARDWFANVQENYDRLKDAVSDGRMAGLISWTAIEDRTRSLQGLQHWNGPAEIMRGVRDTYRTDLWADQTWRPEVWPEKEAMEGVVAKVCNDLRVDFFCTRGYSSQSALWEAGRRFAGYVRKGQTPIVFHLGDHDPSGVHMTEDARERLSVFAGTPIQVVRLALNMDQIQKYKPPPNPVKPKDSRTPAYRARFGIDTCWELDALSTGVIRSLIANAVHKLVDVKKWDAALRVEAEDKERLDALIEEMGE